VTIALSALLVAVGAAVHFRAVGRERRASGYALRATGLLAVVLAGTAEIRLAVPTQAATDATLLAYEAALCVLTAALLAGLARAPWERAPVTDLVLELGEARSGSLRDARAGAASICARRARAPIVSRHGFWARADARFARASGSPGSGGRVARRRAWC
jgi:hypothetical protein